MINSVEKRKRLLELYKELYLLTNCLAVGDIESDTCINIVELHNEAMKDLFPNGYIYKENRGDKG